MKCVKCTNIVDSNFKRCKKCRDRDKNAKRRRRLRRSLENKCRDCNRTRTPDKSRCELCIKKIKKIKEKRQKEGLCRECNTFISDGVRCESCTKNIARSLIKLRKKALNGLGGVCSCCGETEFLFLQIDHINNDGHIDRKNGINSQQLARKVIRENYPSDKYQILCANCNIGKHLNGGTCPHQSSI